MAGGIGALILGGIAALTTIFNPGGLLSPTSEIEILFEDDQVICRIDFGPMRDALDVESLKHDLMPSGIPEGQEDGVLVKGPYLLMYDHENHVPSWVAYRVEPEYTNTPPRKDQFDFFCEDDEIDSEPHKTDFESKGFDRGHMIPFNVSGGDRDGDGRLAGTVIEPESGGEFTDYDDIHDVFTIREINMMSNMAPQYVPFNRNGVWYDAERFVQVDLAENRNLIVWEIAGTIFNDEQVQFFEGNRTAFEIGIPTHFYKIVIIEPDGDGPRILAFLFEHVDSSTGELFDCLVSVNEVEDMAGIEFFTNSDYGVTASMKMVKTEANLFHFTDSETANLFSDPAGCF